MKPESGRASPPRLVVRIAVTNGPHSGATATWYGPGDFVIGRGPQAQLTLPYDLTVSVDHCRVELSAQGCSIHDLGSRRGTLVNGRPATADALRSGDVLSLGMSALVVVITDTADEGATALYEGPRSAAAVTTTVLHQRTAEPAGVLDIPGYTIQRQIGAGGMGVVYEATRDADGERVAIKTIIPPDAAAERNVLFFQREMRLLALLSHPRIVRYQNSGTHAGQIYLIMEYVETVDLEKLLSRLTPARRVQVACGVACQMLEALEFAHGKKLVHRDVKPSNILASQTDGRLHAWLADFGLAKNFELAGLSQLTADQEIRGTPAFMAPEQARDSRYARPAADIYGLAATLLYWLTGKFASGLQPQELEAASLLPAGLPQALNQGLATNPKRRFPTAAAFRDALLPFTRQSGHR